MELKRRLVKIETWNGDGKEEVIVGTRKYLSCPAPIRNLRATIYYLLPNYLTT